MISNAETPHFDKEEFHRRWAKARCSAIRSINPEKDPIGARGAEMTPGLESDWVDAFFSRVRSIEPPDREKSKDALLRAVFENSRKLALSLSRHMGVTFEVQDFRDLLIVSGIPCVQGQWSSRRNARILNRRGCNFCAASGSDACDYWREALDGLVMGLGDKERLARHASVRHGDEACIDVFFTEAVEGRDDAMAWGPVPEHMALELLESVEYFRRQTGVILDLKGFNEGVLSFAFKSSTDAHCGSGKSPTVKFHDVIKEKYPGLELKDVTPQAVLGTQEG